MLNRASNSSPPRNSAEGETTRNSSRTWLRQIVSAGVRRNPRTETWILCIGLACTFFGKFIMLRRQTPPGGLAETIHVVSPDLIFFYWRFSALSDVVYYTFLPLDGSRNFNNQYHSNRLVGSEYGLVIRKRRTISTRNHLDSAVEYQGGLAAGTGTFGFTSWADD